MQQAIGNPGQVGRQQKHQPEGEGFFKNFLRKRSYLHCKACGYFEDVDDYKKQVGSI